MTAVQNEVTTVFLFCVLSVLQVSQLTDGEPPPQSKRKASITVMSNEAFPVKLYEILAELEADGRSSLASWVHHGRCFQVHDAVSFTETVLRRYFSQSQFASFQRQLNLYGFNRIRSGPDKSSYYHEHFLRGNPRLALRIRRTAVKGNGPRRAVDPGAHPDFYTMPFLPTLSPPTAAVAVGAEQTTPGATAVEAMVPPARMRQENGNRPVIVRPSYPATEQLVTHARDGETTTRASIPHSLFQRARSQFNTALDGRPSSSSTEAGYPHSLRRTNMVPLDSTTTGGGGGASMPRLGSLVCPPEAAIPTLLSSAQVPDTSSLVDYLLALQSSSSVAFSAPQPNVVTVRDPRVLHNNSVSPMFSMVNPAAFAASLPLTSETAGSAISNMLARALETTAGMTPSESNAWFEARLLQEQRLNLLTSLQALDQARREEEVRRIIAQVVLNGLF